MQLEPAQAWYTKNSACWLQLGVEKVSIRCGDVGQTENHQPERAVALGPRDLAHLAAWFDRFDQFDGFDRFGSQAIPKCINIRGSHIPHSSWCIFFCISWGFHPYPQTPKWWILPKPRTIQNWWIPAISSHILPWSSVYPWGPRGFWFFPSKHLHLQALLWRAAETRGAGPGRLRLPGGLGQGRNAVGRAGLVGLDGADLWWSGRPSSAGLMGLVMPSFKVTNWKLEMKWMAKLMKLMVDEVGWSC